MDNGQYYNIPPKRHNAFGGFALFFGLVGLIVSFASFLLPFTVVSFFFSLLAIIFGAVGHKRSISCGKGGGTSMAGLILGIIGMVFTVVGLTCSAASYAIGSGIDYSGLFNDFQSII